MALRKKENVNRKWKKMIKVYETSNPEMARRLIGKLAAFAGRKG
jgi:hypothetical protein